jgi:hypothetical protein
MDKYFLITENIGDKTFTICSQEITDVVVFEDACIDVLETKYLCEEKLAEREKEGHKLICIIKGKELKVKAKVKEIVTYEIDETISLGPLKVTVRTIND